MRETEDASVSKKITLVATISLLCFIIAMVPKPVYAASKSLYVIPDIRPPGVGSSISAYSVQSAPTYLVYQGTRRVPIHGSGAVGLAIDSQSGILFMTYEFSNIIQFVNATTFADLGTATVSGASDLAGIVYDHDKRLIYTVNRQSGRLFVHHWDSANYTFTLESQVNLTHSSRAYDIALDEINDILYVADGEYSHKFDWYNTTTWAHLGTKTTTHAVIGIAIDAKNGFIYTSGAWYDYGLFKYDLATKKEIAVLNDADEKQAAVLDVAVDPNQNPSPVYITTFWQNGHGTNGTYETYGSVDYKDVLAVFDSDLNELWRSGDIGNPTAITIPRGEVSYIGSGSISIEHLLIAILCLVACFATFGVFISKRKKRVSIKQKSVAYMHAPVFFCKL